MNKKRMTIEDKLFTVIRKIDTESHIKVDQEKFQKDPNPAIIYLCPSRVYLKNETTGECIVNFENCLECGACQVACRDYVSWDNPRGGKGVIYKYG